MSKLRFEVVTAAFAKKAVEVPVESERPSDYYAVKVFNREKMFKYLPSKVIYEKIIHYAIIAAKSIAKNGEYVVICGE